MSPVSAPIITVTRNFDPRDLDDLVIWLPHFNIPAGAGGTSLSSGQNWLGAPALGSRAGSLVDGQWDFNPASKVYILDDSITAPGAQWNNPWIAGQRALSVQDRYLKLVDAGTSTPHTVTLTGVCTLLLVLRNDYGESDFVLDDGTSTPTTGFSVSTDRMQVWTAGVGSEIDITDDVDFDNSDDGAVTLVMVTRNSSDTWRAWINGTQQPGWSVVQGGTLELKSVFQTFSGFTFQMADVLLYSRDWTSRADDLNTYFRNQWGTP